MSASDQVVDVLDSPSTSGEEAQPMYTKLDVEEIQVTHEEEGIRMMFDYRVCMPPRLRLFGC